LTALTTLDASKNRFDSLPDAVCRLPALETFCFSQNFLFKWPENLGMLTKLVYLDLSCNNLQSYISDEYGSDHGDMLPEDALSAFSQLTHLDLCDCGLMVLPALSCLKHLDTILVHKNHLTAVPSLPPSVRKIDVAFNLLATVSNSVINSASDEFLICFVFRFPNLLQRPKSSHIFLWPVIASLE
jgi:Leucine-rich repeat (LRR) protein